MTLSCQFKANQYKHNERALLVGVIIRLISIFIKNFTFCSEQWFRIGLPDTWKTFLRRVKYSFSLDHPGWNLDVKLSLPIFRREKIYLLIWLSLRASKDCPKWMNALSELRLGRTVDLEEDSNNIYILMRALWHFARHSVKPVQIPWGWRKSFHR